METRKCYKCNKVGHFTKNCRLEQKRTDACRKNQTKKTATKRSVLSEV